MFLIRIVTHGAGAQGRGAKTRAALKRRRVMDSDEPAEPIEAFSTPSRAQQQQGGHQGTPARSTLPQSLAAEASTPSSSGRKRFNWNEGSIAMLLKGIEEYGSACHEPCSEKLCCRECCNKPLLGRLWQCML
jgi:hypothetical protein